MPKHRYNTVLFATGPTNRYLERHRGAKWILVLLGEAALGEQLRIDQQVIHTDGKYFSLPLLHITSIY